MVVLDSDLLELLVTEDAGRGLRDARGVANDESGASTASSSVLLLSSSCCPSSSFSDVVLARLLLVADAIVLRDLVTKTE